MKNFITWMTATTIRRVLLAAMIVCVLTIAPIVIYIDEYPSVIAIPIIIGTVIAIALELLYEKANKKGDKK